VNDDLTTLYGDVLRRLELARQRVRSLVSSEPVKAALDTRLDRLELRAQVDLTRASRRLDALLEELASGVAPSLVDEDEDEAADELAAEDGETEAADTDTDAPQPPDR
jgi:hypothetical protein